MISDEIGMQGLVTDEKAVKAKIIANKPNAIVFFMTPPQFR